MSRPRRASPGWSGQKQNYWSAKGGGQLSHNVIIWMSCVGSLVNNHLNIWFQEGWPSLGYLALGGPSNNETLTCHSSLSVLPSTTQMRIRLSSVRCFFLVSASDKHLMSNRIMCWYLFGHQPFKCQSGHSLSKCRVSALFGNTVYTSIMALTKEMLMHVWFLILDDVGLGFFNFG